MIVLLNKVVYGREVRRMVGIGPEPDEKYSPLAIMIWTTAATQNLFYVGKPLVNHETWPPTNKEPCMKAGGGRRIVDRHLERR